MLMEAEAHCWNAAARRGIPSGWRVDLDGKEIELAPAESRTIAINIDSDAPVGRTSFNLTSASDGAEPGGVTIVVDVEG
jgi:uncharacterized membrane protein